MDILSLCGLSHERGGYLNRPVKRNSHQSLNYFKNRRGRNFYKFSHHPRPALPKRDKDTETRILIDNGELLEQLDVHMQMNETMPFFH